jgi:hypothetical protein
MTWMMIIKTPMKSHIATGFVDLAVSCISIGRQRYDE